MTTFNNELTIQETTILYLKSLKPPKVYNSFFDKYGNEYRFETYIEFSTFWFNLSRKTAKIYFPENFDVLQKAAADSKEARTKLEL